MTLRRSGSALSNPAPAPLRPATQDEQNRVYRCGGGGGGGRIRGVELPGRFLRQSRFIGLFKTELIRKRGPWRNIEDIEFATLEWVWWFNYHRLLEPIGYVPPVEYEEAYYRPQAAQADARTLKQTCLR